MHCDQCGKESRLDSKFCRSCGNSLLEISHSSSGRKDKTFNITWKSPIILIIVTVVILGGIFYGGSKVYSYYQIQSKISSAKKLQSTGDFNGSLSILNNLGEYSPTSGQQNSIDAIKADDQKFLTFKASFDAAVELKKSSSTINLQTALKDLQSIDTKYPIYTDVQTEINKVQILLVTNLQNESESNKKSATIAHEKEVTAQTAKNKAEQDAKSSANAARQEEVLKSFTNQLLVLRNTFSQSGVDALVNYTKAYNSGDYSLATVYGGGVISVCNSTQTNSKALRNTFTGLPVEYNNASINLEWAGYYLCETLSSWVNKDFSLSKEQTGKMFEYYNKVDNFLGV